MTLYQLVMDGTDPRFPGLVVVKNTLTQESVAQPMPGEDVIAWRHYQDGLAAGAVPLPVDTP